MKHNLQTTFSTRQNMLSKDFEIYYYTNTYKSNHDYNINSHTHNYYEFYFFLEGKVYMNIEGNNYSLKQGDVIVIPPNVRHHIILNDVNIPYRRFIFWISVDYCNDLLKLSKDYVYLMQHSKISKHYIFHYDMIDFNSLQSKVFRLIEELHSNRFGKDAKVTLCVNDLILHLNRSVYEMEHPKSQHEKQTLYQNLLLYIEDHIEEPLSLDRLADHFYVSKYHIAHVFKENLGISVHQFITKKRLKMCQQAILSQSNISDVYLMYGFKDYSSFFRAFKKEFGMSPKEYKELAFQSEKKFK